MHYCFLIFGTINNASYIRAKGLGTALIDLGHKVSYVLDAGDEQHRGQLDGRAEVHYVQKPRTIGQFLRRRRLVQQVNADYVEVLNPHLKTLIPLMGLSRPKLVGYWDEPPISKPLSAIRMFRERLIDRWLRARADFILISTHDLIDHFRRRHGIEGIHQPYALYLKEYPETSSPFTEPTFVYMGNLTPLWDHDIFFHAFDVLARRGHKPKLIVMGGGEDLEKWRAWSRERGLDNIELAGFMSGEELWRRLRHAHVLLLPMRGTFTNRCRCSSKTFGYAQAQRPVIANKVGEIPYILGDLAQYCDETPEAMADAIEAAMRQPRMPDVPYDLSQHSWAVRAKQLLKALGQTSDAPIAASAAPAAQAARS